MRRYSHRVKVSLCYDSHWFSSYLQAHVEGQPESLAWIRELSRLRTGKLWLLPSWAHIDNISLETHLVLFLGCEIGGVWEKWGWRERAVSQRKSKQRVEKEKQLKIHGNCAFNLDPVWKQLSRQNVDICHLGWMKVFTGRLIVRKTRGWPRRVVPSG